MLHLQSHHHHVAAMAHLQLPEPAQSSVLDDDDALEDLMSVCSLEEAMPELSTVLTTTSTTKPDATPGDLDSVQASTETSLDLLNTLPIELLILIFSFCISVDPDIAAALSRVSREWRAVMTDLPSLWSHLRLSDTRFDPRRLRAKSDLWLERSAALPLDVDLDTRHRDSVLPLLSFALRGTPKWRRVSYMHSRMRFLTVRDGTEPRLESLLVTLSPKKAMGSDLQPPAHTPPEGLAESPRTWWGGRDAPMTKNFKADGERLREIYVLGVRCLPTPDQLAPFDAVTALVLMNSSTECDFPMHQAVPFLGAFPALESLELSNFNELFLVHDPEYRPDCNELAPAELPHLRRLSVRGICSSRCILSHIRAPRLASLVLIHINSSNVFPHPIPGEPGDSDDEAADFSRSPWTDHATGMGLRRLFADGAPELRELIMDYADLRTKDFIWLFARLARLEKFNIVASDMSDNVVRALEVAMQGEQGEEMAKRAPALPNLMRLKLSKCQKVTGDAIVRMIASRVRAAESGLVTAFEEFSTTECLQVTELHHQDIQEVLPSSTRLIYAPGFEEEE